MTSAFERHGIGHLSASSLNAYVGAPSMWVMERLLKVKTPMGCAAHRGSAVEAGISAGLFDPGLTAAHCTEVAHPIYDRLTALSGDPKRDSERELIAPMVACGLELRAKGAPLRPNLGDQHKVEIMLDGIPVPLVGYLDFEFAEEVVDTKTTQRIPSVMPDGHLRQFSIYKHARMNKRMRGAYISAKRMEIHTLTREQYDTAIVQIVQIAKRLERFLALSDDAEELAALVVHNTDSFYWSSPVALAEGKRIYGY